MPRQNRERRVFKACLNCVTSKRQCSNERPCAQCFLKGLQCKDVAKEVSTWNCSIPCAASFADLDGHRKHA
eukprot:1685044-Rhodomonas_salina.3